MAHKFNRESYPNLFAVVALTNSAVEGQFEVFQSDPEAVVGGKSDSQQVKVPFTLGYL